MVELHQAPDGEIEAIVASTAALFKLADAEARRRVLSYVAARCLPEPPLAVGWGVVPSPVAARSSVAVVEHTQRELPGIARLTEAGDFHVTVGDLKAKSRLAAAVRLAQIAIYAHERLTGRPLSSRKGLTPLLKARGLYDGNSRARLAKEQGILRSGDDLSLDPHARRRAERIIEELQDAARLAETGAARRARTPEPHELSTRPPHFENWDNFANKCSVGLHAVDSNGTILWANETELAFMGYAPEEYIGHSIADFHVDAEVVQDILDRLTRDEVVNAYAARLRAKDGSIRHVMISSNVYRHRSGEFEHSRCFTTSIGEAAWQALKELQKG